MSGEIHEICHSGSEEKNRNFIEICHTQVEITASKFPMAAIRNSGTPLACARPCGAPVLGQLCTVNGTGLGKKTPGGAGTRTGPLHKKDVTCEFVICDMRRGLLYMFVHV